MVVEVVVVIVVVDFFDVVLVGIELFVSGFWEVEFVVVVETIEVVIGRDVEMEEWVV